MWFWKKKLKMHPKLGTLLIFLSCFPLFSWMPGKKRPRFYKLIIRCFKNSEHDITWHVTQLWHAEWTDHGSYRPQRRDESETTVWERITNVFISPSPTSAWQLCHSAHLVWPLCLQQQHLPPFLSCIHCLRPTPTLVNPHLLDLCLDENIICSAGALTIRNPELHLLKYLELAA